MNQRVDVDAAPPLSPSEMEHAQCATWIKVVKVDTVPSRGVCPLPRCLWLLPITAAELAFKKQHGLDALEQRFEAAGFNALDPTRASVV